MSGRGSGGTAALWSDPSPRRRLGRTERQADAAVAALRAAGRLDPTSAAAVVALREAARNVDAATRIRDSDLTPYAVVAHATALREYRAAILDLGAVPGGGAERDPFDAFLEGLGAAEVHDGP